MAKDSLSLCSGFSLLFVQRNELALSVCTAQISSVCLGCNLFLCSLMRSFYLEGPNSVSLCSPMHFVYCVCLEGPNSYMLTIAPSLSVFVWIGQKSGSVSCIIVFIWDMPSSRKMMIEASFEGMRASPLFMYKGFLILQDVDSSPSPKIIA